MKRAQFMPPEYTAVVWASRVVLLMMGLLGCWIGYLLWACFR